MSEDQLQEGQFQQSGSDKESSQYIKSRPAGRTHICGVCRSLLSKYTCPKCGEKTCSLTCNKKHKNLKSCIGLVKPNQYIAMTNYNEENVKKDFSFVKEMIEKTDKVKKCLTGVTYPAMEPKRFKILRYHAKKMHNITLYHAPTIIERHRENISFYFMKTKEIFWVFELMFLRKKDKQKQHNSHKEQYQWSHTITLPTSDSKTFSQLIINHNFLCSQLLQRGINTLKVQQFNIYLKNKSDEEDEKPIFLKFDVNAKISTCLKDIKVYQFPTLMIVHNSYSKSFLDKFTR